MFLLYIFGTALESSKGSKLLLVSFFIGGMASLKIGIPLYSPDTKIVGSSIAISSVIGAVLVMMPFKPAPIFLFRAPLGLIATIYLIFNAFFAYWADSSLYSPYTSRLIGFFVGVGIPLLIIGVTRSKQPRTPFPLELH
jgi:membrane associated rhomboid family serine protease